MSDANKLILKIFAEGGSVHIFKISMYIATFQEGGGVYFPTAPFSNLIA